MFFQTILIQSARLKKVAAAQVWLTWVSVSSRQNAFSISRTANFDGVHVFSHKPRLQKWRRRHWKIAAAREQINLRPNWCSAGSQFAICSRATHHPESLIACSADTGREGGRATFNPNAIRPWADPRATAWISAGIDYAARARRHKKKCTRKKFSASCERRVSLLRGAKQPLSIVGAASSHTRGRRRLISKLRLENDDDTKRVHPHSKCFLVEKFQK